MASTPCAPVKTGEDNGVKLDTGDALDRGSIVGTYHRIEMAYDYYPDDSLGIRVRVKNLATGRRRRPSRRRLLGDLPTRISHSLPRTQLI